MSNPKPKSDDKDLLTIPYDAPLSIPEPSYFFWITPRTWASRNWTYLTVPPADLTGKWIILSGANNGIGREAVLQFAEWGANIILACRDPPAKEVHPRVVVQECLAKGKEGQVIEWWELDMAELGTVDAFADRWLATGRALDILCNNAGLGSSPGGEDIMKTKDGFEIMHQVNFLSHVLLTHRLLPSLSRARAPRIVCTTSSFHYYGRFPLTNFNGEANQPGPSGVQLYMNNKLWFQIWLTELQSRLSLHPDAGMRRIVVNGVHPGYVNTGVWNFNKQESGVKGLVEKVLKVMAQLIGIDAQQGSLAILHAAVSEDAGGAGEGKGGGRYFNRIWEAEAMPHCHDPDCRMRVWRKVCEELGLEQKGLLKGLGEDPFA
ncbi:NAD(P)-binding protein [Athelia psychrophila]|uniref:NAD(P)-binding protein n=1 Tax=Athelia psychrophila TaxID=1759441 RepID=A0A166CJI6_9AGAM|nr:NAD(P)-binding protein [Fibularhizoctonia sp. CBS 109695]